MKAKGLLFAVLSAMCYGTSALWMLMSLNSGARTTSILFIRTMVSALMMLSICLVSSAANGKKELNPLHGISIKEIISNCLVGGCFYSLQSGLYLTSLKYNSVSLATMLFCTYPVFVPLIMIAAGKEKFSIKRFAALAMALIGLALLLELGSEEFSIIGVFIGTCSGIVYAFYIFGGTIAADHYSKANAVQRSMLMMIGADIAYFFAALFSGSLTVFMPAQAYLGIVLFSLFCNLIPMVLFWSAVKIIGPTKTSILGIIEPITAAVLAVTVLGEHLTLRKSAGIIIVLLAITWSTGGDNKKY